MRAFFTSALTALVCALSLVAPAGGAGSSDVSESCDEAPVRLRVLSGDDPSVGGERFKVKDAVARRVPILPDPDGKTTSDPEVLERQRDRAAKTDLALYSLYLADFKIPRKDLTGFGFGVVDAKPGKTVATMTVVPPKERGLREGDVVRDGDLRYDTTTTFATVGLVVQPRTGALGGSFDDVDGRVKVPELDEESICLDMDLEFSLDGELTAAIGGVVRAPLVKASPSFYFR